MKVTRVDDEWTKMIWELKKKLEQKQLARLSLDEDLYNKLKKIHLGEIDKWE